MINRGHRTNVMSDQDFAVCETVSLLHAISSLQQNANTSAFHLNSPYNPAHPFDPPLISSSLLTTTRRLLTAVETASTCNFMKAFTVHATNRAQWQPVATGCIRYIQMCLATYVPCKCTLVRDARRDPTWPVTVVYLLLHTCSATQICEQKFASICLISKR